MSMKILVYRFKEDNRIKNIQMLKDYQIKEIEEKDSINKYNNNKKVLDYATMYEIGVDELPKDLLEQLIASYCDRKQIKLEDIYDKLLTLEDEFSELSFDISNIKDDVNEVLKEYEENK